MIIAISGKSGSGKSKLSFELSEKMGCKIIDIDKYVKDIRDEYKEEISQLVNNKNIIVDNKIDSKVLGKILFNDKKLMDKYNEYIYSFLKKKLDEEINVDDNVIIDSMFLPMMDVFKLCDYKILLKCDDDIRYKRLASRDNLELEYIKKRDGFSLNYKDSEFDLLINTELSYNIDEIIEKIKRH